MILQLGETQAAWMESHAHDMPAARERLYSRIPTMVRPVVRSPPALPAPRQSSNDQPSTNTHGAAIVISNSPLKSSVEPSQYIPTSHNVVYGKQCDQTALAAYDRLKHGHQPHEIQHITVDDEVINPMYDSSVSTSTCSYY